MVLRTFGDTGQWFVCSGKPGRTRHNRRDNIEEELKKVLSGEIEAPKELGSDQRYPLPPNSYNPDNLGNWSRSRPINPIYTGEPEGAGASYSQYNQGCMPGTSSSATSSSNPAYNPSSSNYSDLPNAYEPVKTEMVEETEDTSFYYSPNRGFGTSSSYSPSSPRHMILEMERAKRELSCRTRKSPGNWTGSPTFEYVPTYKATSPTYSNSSNGDPASPTYTPVSPTFPWQESPCQDSQPREPTPPSDPRPRREPTPPCNYGSENWNEQPEDDETCRYLGPTSPKWEIGKDEENGLEIDYEYECKYQASSPTYEDPDDSANAPSGEQVSNDQEGGGTDQEIDDFEYEPEYQALSPTYEDPDSTCDAPTPTSPQNNFGNTDSNEPTGVHSESQLLEPTNPFTHGKSDKNGPTDHRTREPAQLQQSQSPLRSTDYDANGRDDSIRNHYPSNTNSTNGDEQSRSRQYENSYRGPQSSPVQNIANDSSWRTGSERNNCFSNSDMDSGRGMKTEFEEAMGSEQRQDTNGRLSPWPFHYQVPNAHSENTNGCPPRWDSWRPIPAQHQNVNERGLSFQNVNSGSREYPGQSQTRNQRPRSPTDQYRRQSGQESNSSYKNRRQDPGRMRNREKYNNKSPRRSDYNTPSTSKSGY